MKPGTIVLAAAALAFAASLGGCLWLVGRYMPGFGLDVVFADADILIKLLMMITIVVILIVAVLGVIGLASRGAARGMGVALAIFSGVSALFGGLALLYGWTRIQAGTAAVGTPIGLDITAPSWAEALLALSLGLFGAMLGLGVRALILRRR